MPFLITITTFLQRKSTPNGVLLVVAQAGPSITHSLRNGPPDRFCQIIDLKPRVAGSSPF